MNVLKAFGELESIEGKLDVMVSRIIQETERIFRRTAFKWTGA